MSQSPAGAGPGRRVLFCSFHCLLDPSSGAAVASRDLLRAMAGWGWECRALCGPQLDFEHAEELPRVLGDARLAAQVRQERVGPLTISLFHLPPDPVPVSVYTGNPRRRGNPTAEEANVFLALAERTLDRFGPQLLLTYGGHAVTRQLMARARQRGVAVVFALHNFAYHDARWFAPAHAVLVPSRFARDYYQRHLGLSCAALPPPLDWSRFYAPPPDGGCYVTFVNPQPAKGVGWFVRLAAELGRRRPDIPLLVVEGRGGVGWLRRAGQQLSGLTTLHRMASTPDPRDFYRVSRLVLMPSLWDESFGLVAAEALANGIPVLASRRGALPEVLAQAGFLFDIPERYTPESRIVPSAEEVSPWLETVIRLWDDAALYERERRRCLAAAEAWRPQRLAERFEEFFGQVLRPA